MIDLSDIAIDPDLSQSYIIHRKVGHWDAGRFVQTELDPIYRTGVVTNANPKELFQLPEGDRVGGVMVFYSNQPIYETHAYAYNEAPDDPNAAGTSDEIEWNGDRYRVSTVYDYSGQGFYKVFAVYMDGD